jgi:hypothetical protein
MILGTKVLEKLRELINEETEYRSGPKLVKFFNELGFNDTYGQGFPSRWMYTDEKLNSINGTPELDKCIKTVFAPINYVGKFNELDELVKDFNQFLVFDKWKVVREEAEISFQKLEKVKIDNFEKKNDEYNFLNQEFNDLNFDNLKLEGMFVEVLSYRIEEIEKCFLAEAPLSVILLAGSTLEGVLLGVATKYPKEFNSSMRSPKDINNKVKQFHLWSLNNLVDVAMDVGLVRQDVHKFSHSLKDFRNYIHPFEQAISRFKPTMHTAKICLQVLKVAIHQINENVDKVQGNV